MNTPRLRFVTLLAALAGAALARGTADYTAPYAVTTLAGASSIGSQDGTGATARFYNPRDVVVDPAGNAYITDEGNHTIRKVTPAGMVTTFAGSAGLSGSADGAGTIARFDSPQGLAITASGVLYVADTGNHTIRKITPDGVVSTLAGLAGWPNRTNGTGAAARFFLPLRVTIDREGNVLATDAYGIRKITPAGEVTNLAVAQFSESEPPASYGAIAVDASGNAYAARAHWSDYVHSKFWWEDYYRYVGFLTKYAPSGEQVDLLQTTVDRYVDRIVGQSISDLELTRDGRISVAYGHQIGVLASDGAITTADGPAPTAHFGAPFTFAYDNTGAILVVDTTNNMVQKVTGNLVAPFAGLAREDAEACVDGLGGAARFSRPGAVVLDANGNLFVADTSAHCIRKITPDGMTTTFAGVPGSPGAINGPGNTARFQNPTGLAIDRNDNLYVADSGNFIIRKITAGGQVSTLAGTAGQKGAIDGAAASAQFSFPIGISVDDAGNVFVADHGNDSIRLITPAGQVSTFAGTSGQTGIADGQGAAARFTGPVGLAIGVDANLYVTETSWTESANRILTKGYHPRIARIRKITPTGTVTTLAGGEQGYEDGAAATARFNFSGGIAVDRAGDLFIADRGNQTIRRITPSGTVTTLAGLFDSPGSTDGVGQDARFYYPEGIAVDHTGAIYVSSGTTIRKGFGGTRPTITAHPVNQSVAPETRVVFTVTAAGNPAPTYQWQFNGSAIAGATDNTFTLGNARTTDAGDYTVVVTNSLGSVTSNKATLTVTPPSTPPPASGGNTSGGGGGGAPSLWFGLALCTLAALRTRSRFCPSSGRLR